MDYFSRGLIKSYHAVGPLQNIWTLSSVKFHLPDPCFPFATPDYAEKAITHAQVAPRMCLS